MGSFPNKVKPKFIHFKERKPTTLGLTVLFIFLSNIPPATWAEHRKPTSVNLAVILPTEDQNPFQEPCFGIRKVKPVVELAMEAVAKLLGPDHVNITAKYLDSRCSDTYGPIAAMQLFFAGEVDVFLGPCCKYALAPVARFATVWGLPVISPGGLTSAFSTKPEYPMLTRINSPYDNIAKFLVSTLIHLEYKTISLLWHNNFFNRDLGQSECWSIVDAYIRLVRKEMIIPEPNKESFDENSFEMFDWDAILEGIRVNSRESSGLAYFDLRKHIIAQCSYFRTRTNASKSAKAGTRAG